MHRRIDHLTRIYIDAVLNSVPSIGRPEAALLLRELGVPVETALRVLTRPHERRQSFGRRLLAVGPASEAAR